MNIKSLQEAFKNQKQITWSKDYQVEDWRDGSSPLTILDIYKWGNIYIVSYKCSDKNCLRCNSTVCPICREMDCRHTAVVYNHHKFLKENGLDEFGRNEEVKRNKKTEIILTDQMVFEEIK